MTPDNIDLILVSSKRDALTVFFMDGQVSVIRLVDTDCRCISELVEHLHKFIQKVKAA